MVIFMDGGVRAVLLPVGGSDGCELVVIIFVEVVDMVVVRL